MSGSEQTKPAAFLSYAHADDHEGGVARFIEHLNREISLQLGQAFDIFRDRADLRWGDNWKRRINESLDSVTFLIAVLSPSFFSSKECVREVNRFIDRERDLGRDDLVFPVVWIKPDEVPADRRELWELLCKRQHTNWERFRHHRPPYPVTARRQIERLAKDVNRAIRRAPRGSRPKAESPKSPDKTPLKVDRRKAAHAKRLSASPDSAARAGDAGALIEELRPESTTHQRRLEIGLRLAAIGDPREGVGVIDGVPEILWREVPRGEVEIEGHGSFEVETFHVAAHPVSNAQFQAFVEAEDGYRSQDCWKGLSASENHRSPVEPRWSEANHPRERVSWYEATAFCNWLTAKLGYAVRLPDQQEWQWAAQSARANFAYPWGPTWKNGCANTAEARLGRTTAVGAYPSGNSLQQVSDLAGNIWEWCRNESGNPKSTDEGGTGPRVLRGGSWGHDQDFARAVVRSRVRPSLRYHFIGFRVACSSPIR